MRSIPPTSTGPRRLALFLLLVGVLCGGLAPSQNEPPQPLAVLTGAIYFDAWQLEKEITISPLALQQWLDLGLTADSRLDKSQREALKPKIGEFLENRCPVLIDGDEVEFTLDRIHFVEPNDKEFLLIADEVTVAVRDVRVTAIFAAPNTKPDQALQLIWNLFPEGVEKVVITAADVVGARAFKVSAGTPTVNVLGRYELGARDIPQPPPAPARATLAIPWLTVLLLLFAIPVLIRLVRSDRPRAVTVVLLLALAGGAAAARKHVTFPIAHPFDKTENLDDAQTALILDHLLRGVYHAFDYRDRSEQYDILAKVVDGDALESIFLEVQRTLESREKDGSRVRVNDLTVEESPSASLPDRRGFQSECAWEVRGRVGHWGHFHDRLNLYRATFVVEPIDGVWKITGLTLHARDREAAPAPAPTPRP